MEIALTKLSTKDLATLAQRSISNAIPENIQCILIKVLNLDKDDNFKSLFYFYIMIFQNH